MRMNAGGAGKNGEHAGLRPGASILDDGRVALTLVQDIQEAPSQGNPPRPLTADAAKACLLD